MNLAPAAHEFRKPDPALKATPRCLVLRGNNGHQPVPDRDISLGRKAYRPDREGAGSAAVARKSAGGFRARESPFAHHHSMSAKTATPRAKKLTEQLPNYFYFVKLAFSHGALRHNVVRAHRRQAEHHHHAAKDEPREHDEAAEC